MRRLAALLIFLASSAQAAETCPAKTLCTQLKTTIAACKNGAQCDTFLAVLKKLAPQYNCTVKGQKVAAIHRCDYALEEEAFDLLGTLKTPAAMAYFCSPIYAKTLGASLSETLHQRGLDEDAQSAAYYKNLTNCDELPHGQ